MWRLLTIWNPFRYTHVAPSYRLKPVYIYACGVIFPSFSRSDIRIGRQPCVFHPLRYTHTTPSLRLPPAQIYAYDAIRTSSILRQLIKFEIYRVSRAIFNCSFNWSVMPSVGNDTARNPDHKLSYTRSNKENSDDEQLVAGRPEQCITVEKY